MKVKLVFLMLIFFFSLVTIVKSECIESWVCQDYSPCINSKITRSCVDINDCGTTLYKPKTSKDCSIPVPEVKESSNFFAFSWFLWILIPLVFVIIILFVVLQIIKHKEKPYKALEEPKIKTKTSLEDYIKQALADGVSESDIVKNLIDVGWPAERVKQTMNKLSQKKLDKKVPKSELEASIENALKKGFSKKQIREILIKKKWPPSKIDPILKKK